MPKKLFLVLLASMGLLYAQGNPVFASPVEVNSKITQVTVYPETASLTRSASLNLEAGEHTILFSNIIADLDEDSLKVSAQGSPEVKIYGAEFKKEFLEEVPSARIKQLKEEMQRFEDEKKKTEAAKTILQEEKSFLDSIRLYADVQMPKDLVTKMPQATELDTMLKFLDTKYKENSLSFIDSEFRMRDIDNKIDVLKRQLAEVSGQNKKLQRSIAVDILVQKPGVVGLNVSYLVSAASWQPLYEARANFEKSEVELISNGIVSQNTGEDWEAVDISLSTARPVLGGNMPSVIPWFLRPYQPRILSKSRGDLSKKESQRILANAAFDAMEVSAPESKAAEPEYAQPEEKGIALLYKLPKKVNVKSDGSEHKLPISTQTVSAQFEYSAYPRSVPNAYLGSKVTNAPNVQLLGGRVNIFLEGDFVGASSIATIGPGEIFDLYLGMDENVKVKREQVEKKVDETLFGNIASSVKRTLYTYKLTVENYKTKKVKVKLFEAMPVSEDDRIKVKISPLALSPKTKDWEDKKGVWLWELELEPKQKQEIVYSFTIEQPREMQVEGL